MFVGSDHSLGKIRDMPLLYLDENLLKRVKVIKSLGVYIDERLSWLDHINYISEKICADHIILIILEKNSHHLLLKIDQVGVGLSNLSSKINL